MKSMELKDFVSQTCKQIIDGVVSAQEYANKKGAVINPMGLVLENGSSRVEQNYRDAAYLDPQTIDFDIAVTTSEGGEAKAGIGVFVGPIGVGTQGRIEEGNMKVNQIKFSIPIVFPCPPQ